MSINGAVAATGSSVKPITAAQAIRYECRCCIGAAQSSCNTKVCKLHPGVFECRSSVKRIKAHCLECAAQDIGESPRVAVAGCSGRLLRENGNEIRWTGPAGVERGICFLHPYRFGKNPRRAAMSPERKKKAVEIGSRSLRLLHQERKIEAGIDDPTAERGTRAKSRLWNPVTDAGQRER